MEGVRLIKRICGHESPFTFKKNERYGKQRYAKFMATKCPACTVADIQAREAKQKAESKQRKELAKRIKARKAALEKQQAEGNDSAKTLPPGAGGEESQQG